MESTIFTVNSNLNVYKNRSNLYGICIINRKCYAKLKVKKTFQLNLKSRIVQGSDKKKLLMIRQKSVKNCTW